MQILELWVMLDSGIQVYHKVFSKARKKSISGDLFSGFMTAMLSFGSNIGIGELESLQMENLNLYYIKTSESIIVSAITDKKSQSTEVIEVLKKIAGRFSEYFPVENRDLLDTNDPTFSLFANDIVSLIESNGKTKEKDINEKVLSLERIFHQVLIGKLTVDEVLDRVEKLLEEERLTNKEKDVLRSNFNDIKIMAEKLGLDSSTIQNIEKFEEGLSTWLSKTREFLEKGW
ncbi:MAG: hypothetical protein ACTSW1_01780 [Candidatus Hodarchaeales archaeon]